MTVEEIKQLHRKYALNDEVYQIIFDHCQIVWEISNQFINNKSLIVNAELVQTGALLHDIGAYKLIKSTHDWDEKNYIRHGLLGYELLTMEGVDSAVAEIAQRHTGVGLTKEDIQQQQLPLPANDYVARTIEERLIMYADKFHSKTFRFNSFESCSKSIARFGADKLQKFQEFAQEFGTPDLKELAAKYNQPII